MKINAIELSEATLRSVHDKIMTNRINENRLLEADLIRVHVPKSDSLTSPFEFCNRKYGLRGKYQIRIKVFSSNKAYGSK
jgi:hypothetical protein